MSKVSPKIMQSVAEIAAKFRDKGKIDCKAEMEQIGKLLNRTKDLTDADKEYLEQKLEEGRKNTSQRIGENLKGKVSKFIQDFISKTSSLEGNKNKIDGAEEIKIVENYLKHNRENLSMYEVEYIKNELFKGSNDIPQLPKVKKNKPEYPPEMDI